MKKTSTYTMNKRVLVVEDHDSLRQLIGSYLSRSYNVVSAKNGLEAMGCISNGNIPDVIVTDIHMPEFSGEQFVDVLRCSGAYRNIPVVVISGSSSSEEERRVRSKGVAGYFSKPFNPIQLQEHLDGILETPQLAVA